MKQLFKSEMQIISSPHTLPQGYNIHAAYLTWYCLGYIGAHNFYLKKFYRALLQSTLFTVGFLTIPQKFGILPLSILAIMLIVDFIRMPGIIKHKNHQILSSPAR